MFKVMTGVLTGYNPEGEYQHTYDEIAKNIGELCSLITLLSHKTNTNAVTS